MARRIARVVCATLGIAFGLIAGTSFAEDGPILLGPDAQPPRVEPRPQGRQPQTTDPRQPDVNGARTRVASAAPATSQAPRPYLSQAAQPRANPNRIPTQQVQRPGTPQGYRQSTQRAAAPNWANLSRAPEAQVRQPSRAQAAQPTPEQLRRYQLQVQERARAASRDPRQAGTGNQRRPAAPRTASAAQPKRDYRALFEPPQARQTRPPGQPRRIVVGGYPSASDPNIPNSAAQRLGSADGRRPTINSGPTGREILQ
jgi:hypothetical protein